MAVSEQELFGLMAVAQEQQKAAAEAAEQLKAQQAELEKTIERARAAVASMEASGQKTGQLIQQGAQHAVSEAVSGALGAIRGEVMRSVGGAVKPAVTALEGVSGRAEQAGQVLNRAASGFSWKWFSMWVLAACLLLATVLGIASLLVPSPGEIRELRATAEAWEQIGGKVNWTYCGDDRRLCAEIDTRAGAYGKDSQYRILKGY